jgi:hypothetical protein
MELEGSIWKEGKFWIVEVPSLDISTQGRTKKEALLVIKDAVLELFFSYFKNKKPKNFNVSIREYKHNIIGIAASDKKLLLALSLRRQREKEGLTVRDVSKRLKSKSPNAYFQYETAKINISFDQYEKLLKAINPRNLLRLAQG